MNRVFKQCLAGLFFIALSITPATAFDDDFTLSFPDFNRENFLDIAAYQYRLKQEEQWLQTDNGFRLSGGSLGQDTLHTTLNIKYRKHLNKHTEFRVSSKQLAFYGQKPLRHAVEIGVRPLPWLYMSYLGTPTYDKRSSEMGSAIEIGQRPNNFIRFAYIRHDVFFNDKNSIDDAYYMRKPKERQFQWAQQIGNSFWLRLNLIEDTRFQKELASDQSGFQGQFNHKGDSAKLTLNYGKPSTSITGFTIEEFNWDKSLTLLNEDRSQSWSYVSAQIYHLFLDEFRDDITLGLRHDQLQYDTQNNLNSQQSVDSYFDTSQMYAYIYKNLAPHLISNTLFI